MSYFMNEAQRREYEDSMYQESLSQGEYMREALYQYASAHGADRPGNRWILSPFDTWESNPHWDGSNPYQPHPEDEYAQELYYNVGAHAVMLYEEHLFDLENQAEPAAGDNEDLPF